MRLTLRGLLGRKLTVSEMDGNFVYLEDISKGLSQSLSSISGATGSTGSIGATGSTGSIGATGPSGVVGIPEYIRVSISNGSLYTTASVIDLYSPSNSNILSVVNNKIILNPSNIPGKIYSISISFYVYNNASEPYSYQFKIDGVNYGVDLNLGQNASDFSYMVNTISDIVFTDVTAGLEFWRVSNNSLSGNLIGNILVHEIR